MSFSIASFLSLCQSAPQQPLMAGLALAGLVGGATHCAAMCTPILVAIGADKGTPVDFLSLQSGRLLSYAALGAAGATFNRLLWSEPLFAIAGVLLLSGGAMLMVLTALPPTRLMLARGLMQLYRPFAPRIYRLLGRTHRLPPSLRFGASGLLFGFMPCSMIIAALMAVSATGDAATAAIGMAVFVLATMPSLWLSTRLLGRARHRYPSQTRWIEPIAMMASAAIMMTHVRSLIV